MIIAVSKAKTKTTKNQPKKRRAPAKAKRQSLISLKKSLAVIALVLALAVLWAALIEQFAQKPGAVGATVQPTFTSSNYKDLDLSVAQKAGYSNSALRVVKDLGAVNGVNKAIVSFGVPKDGLFEYAYMTRPSTPPASGKYPVIILCHGYGDPEAYSTSATYFEDMNFYSHHGFLVVKPDLRGQGLSLSKGSPDGAFFSMGYNTDLMSLIAALKKTTYIDSGSINLWGHSMGAYLALRVSVLSKDIKDVILLSTPGDVVEQAQASYIAVSDRVNPVAAAVRGQQLALHGDPLDNTSYWQKTSPLNYLAGSVAYIQIHVGTADKVVPPLFSENLDKKLSAASKAHEYYVYQGSGHGLSAERPLIWQRSLQLLTR
jgi:dipeptidyl aminopeptidase/acylaminoacyl peptidase